MRPSRSLPQPGAPARVWHFSGEAEPVAIVEVREEGRCVVVAAVDGTLREFTLRRANAFFIERGSQYWPRLEF